MYIKKTNRQRDQRHYFNKKLGRIDGIPSSSEMFRRIAEIDNLKAKALCSLFYLSGARLGEISRKFRPNQIQEIEREGHLFVHLVDIPTLKKRGDAEQNPRTIPLYKEKFKPLLYYIYAYIRQNNIDPNKPIFPENKRYIEKLTDKYLGMSPHRIRHIRATNLSSEDGYTDAMLRALFNWSPVTNTGVYTHANVRSLEMWAVPQTNTGQ